MIEQKYFQPTSITMLSKVEMDLIHGGVDVKASTESENEGFFSKTKSTIATIGAALLTAGAAWFGMRYYRKMKAAIPAPKEASKLD